MKKNELFILGTTLLYSYLFYQEAAGLNFFLFSLGLTLLSALGFRQATRTVKWKLAAVGTVLSGFAVFYLGNTLAIVGNVLSICLLSAYTFESRTSVITAWFYSVYTLVTSIFYMTQGIFVKKNPDNQPYRIERKGSAFIMILLPFLMLVVYFFLYRQGNVLFLEFTRKINFDFISFSWICFTLAGLLLMYSFFSYRTVPALLASENRMSNKLEDGQLSPFWFRKILPISQEFKSGVIMLAMLNGLTLLVNGLDFRFLFWDGKLPSGIGYSEFVHQGIGALMLSIFFAIGLILFYFRSELNFAKGRNILAWLTYSWIAQNIFMLYTCFVKNGMYIHEYGLTYKRIGVLVWLMLVLFGLITTAIKVYSLRSNIFLIRINAWLCYGSLILATPVNWDRYMATYNVTSAHYVDYAYLFSLSDNALPAVCRAYQSGNPPQIIRAFKEDGRYLFDEDSTPYSFRNLLHARLSVFLADQYLATWKSECLSRNQVEKELMKFLNPKS
jgi:hypothetical protein